MRNILEQFGKLATNFKNKPFLLARLKLTVFYTCAVFIVLVVFSFAVYSLFVDSIGSDFGNEVATYEIENNVDLFVDKVEDRLGTILITVDGIIIILISGLSYYLAVKTQKPVEFAYFQQKKFVADAAHELRTPLTVMKTGTEAILSVDNSKEEYKKMLVDSLEEINHLGVIVDDLLFLARSDSLQKANFYRINLSVMVGKQVELMRAYAEKKQISIGSNIQDELYIIGNNVYLKRLIVNLIKNAIDYNKPQGEVLVSLSGDGNRIYLEIVDTGIGISKTDLRRIFNRFYKADQAHTKQSGGAGLGLSIVQEIVNLHQATIEIKSELNTGTEVIVMFNPEFS